MPVLQPPAPLGGPTSTVWHHRGHGWAGHSYRHSCSSQKQELSFSDLHWSASLLSTVPDISIYSFLHCILELILPTKYVFAGTRCIYHSNTATHIQEEKDGRTGEEQHTVAGILQVIYSPAKPTGANRAHFAPADSTKPPPAGPQPPISQQRIFRAQQTALGFHTSHGWTAGWPHQPPLKQLLQWEGWNENLPGNTSCFALQMIQQLKSYCKQSLMLLLGIRSACRALVLQVNSAINISHKLSTTIFLKEYIHFSFKSHNLCWRHICILLSLNA